MSIVGTLAREAFQWLEDEGFRYVGEEARAAPDSISIFERGPIAVLVHWDGRDRMTWTVLARGHRNLRWLPGRQLGLGHLGSGAPDADLPLPDPAVDPEPLRKALAWDSRLLRTRGASLLNGERAAWADLEQLQKAHLREGR